MPDNATKRNPLVVAFVSLVIIVVAGGLALGLAGVGAQLSESRDLRVTIYSDDLPPAVAAMVRVGDPVFTDPGGMVVGEIVDVEIGPTVEPVPDFAGRLQAAENPVKDAVTIVVAAQGREGEGVVAIDNQVIQAGMGFNVVTNRYMLKGVVTGVELD